MTALAPRRSGASLASVGAISGERSPPEANAARSRSRSFWPTLTLTLALLPHPAQSAEMLVQGEVLEVIPLTRSGTAVAAEPDCHPAKPPGGNLIALLEWDLRTICRPLTAHHEIASYRVYYEWDGRTYSRVMSEPPGETVPLRVRLE